VEKGERVVHLFVPANPDSTKAIHPTLPALHHPPPRPKPHRALDHLRFCPARPDVGCKATLPQGVPHFGVVLPCVQTQPLGPSLGGAGPWDDQALPRVFDQLPVGPIGSGHDQRPTTPPCPSGSRLRLPPLVARSGGWGPVVFPPAGRLGQRPVPAQPAPVQPLSLLNLFHPRLPQLQHHPRRHPVWKPVRGRGMGTHSRGGIERPPLTARASDVEEGSGTLAIGNPGAPAATARRVLVHRHYGLEHGPECIRDPVAGRPLVHSRPRALPSLRFCCCHAPQVTTDRLFG
jgi:hypothetical protein